MRRFVIRVAREERGYANSRPCGFGLIQPCAHLPRLNRRAIEIPRTIWITADCVTSSHCYSLIYHPAAFWECHYCSTEMCWNICTRLGSIGAEVLREWLIGNQKDRVRSNQSGNTPHLLACFDLAGPKREGESILHEMNKCSCL